MDPHTAPPGIDTERTVTASSSDNGFALSICLRGARSGFSMTISKGRRPIDEGRYDAAKAAQVVAYLALKTANRTLAVLKAIKLVYLGDRESVQQWGEPILDEPRHALPLGPVNTLTLSYVDGHGRNRAAWSRYIEERRGNTVSVKPDVTVADLNLLSESDVEILDDVWDRFGWMQRFALSTWTHDESNVPEWSDPDGGRLPITLESMMRAVGLDDAAGRAARVEGYRGIGDVLRART